MVFKYQSGEEIREGDRVLYHGEPGHVDFVADPLKPNSETDWYIREYGGGVMLVVPQVFGSVFLDTTEDDVDLVFASRSEGFEG
jgi:hypothetical protein